jgi:PTH1 family peptidyl-tRNA hydrolase
MSEIRLIAALGNPGTEYAQTRHNAGWVAADALASSLGLKWKNSVLARAQISEFVEASRKLFLIKPLTFMNLSGSAIEPVARYHKIRPEEILVVHDDIAFEMGQMKLSFGGTAGGHNGVDSIIQRLGPGFWRLRLGVGAKPHGFELPDWVLGKLPEPARVAYAGSDILKAFEEILKKGPELAQNTLNRTGLL